MSTVQQLETELESAATAYAVMVRLRDALRAERVKLLTVLGAMRRCPGVHTTDQVTGETFATLLDEAGAPRT